jgi:hypothetical protein
MVTKPWLRRQPTLSPKTLTQNEMNGVPLMLHYSQVMATLTTAIEYAVQYLLNNCDENGRFAYLRYPADLKFRVRANKYNLLRHAGAMYSLAQAYEWATILNDAGLKIKIETALKRAAGYLLQKIAEVPGMREVKAVWSPAKEEENANTSGREAKLGGSGLGLIALSCVEIIRPNSIPLLEMQRLAYFLLSMILPNGACISKLDEHGQPTPFISSYYPGEAALGLAHLYLLEPNPKWRNTAIAIIRNLARTYYSMGRYISDHWAVLATEKLMSSVDGNFDKRPFWFFSAKICLNMLSEQNAVPAGGMLDGAFKGDGTLTPTAIRLEALLAALNFMPEDQFGTLKQAIEKSVWRGISFLSKNQIRNGDLAGGFPRAAQRLSSGNQDTTKDAQLDKFNRRVQEVRIDYVQHALSAMIACYKLLCNRATIC